MSVIKAHIPNDLFHSQPKDIRFAVAEQLKELENINV